MNLLGDLVYRITGQTDQFDKSLDKSQGKMKGFGSSILKLGGVLAAVFSVKLLIDFSKKIIGLASDAEETGQKFRVVFKGVGDAANAAKRLSQNYGLASVTSQRLLGDTADLLQGFGIAKDESLKLSEQTQQLAVDLASFSNFAGGAEGASAALTKGLLGEREGMKALGIAIGETDLKEFAEDQGIAWGELSKGEKAALTLQLAIKQSANAVGDFERSSGSFANQMRVAGNNIQETNTILGEAFLPIANVAVTLFNDMAGASRDAAQSVKDFTTSAEGARIIGDVLGTVAGTLSIIKEIGGIAFAEIEDAAKTILEPFGQLGTATLDSGLAFTILGNVMQGVVVGLRITSVAIAGAVDNIIQLGKTIYAIGGLVGDFFGLLTGKTTVKELKESLAATGDAFKNLGTGLVDNFTDLYGKIKTEISGFGDGAEESAERFRLAFEKSSGDIATRVRTALIEAGNMSDLLANKNEEGAEKTEEAWSNAFSNITKKAKDYVDTYISGLDSVSQIASNLGNAELMRLEKQIESEEEGSARRIELEEAYEKKKKELARNEAKRQKALNLFKAVIDTASAIVEALPNIPLAIGAGILGAAQTAAIATEPLPALANGAVIPAGSNTKVMAGEGSVSEAFLPLNDETFDKLGAAVARHMSTGDMNLSVNVAGGGRSQASVSLDDIYRASLRGQKVINMRGVEA